SRQRGQLPTVGATAPRRERVSGVGDQSQAAGGERGGGHVGGRTAAGSRGRTLRTAQWAAGRRSRPGCGGRVGAAVRVSAAGSVASRGTAATPSVLDRRGPARSTGGGAGSPGGAARRGTRRHRDLRSVLSGSPAGAAALLPTARLLSGHRSRPARRCGSC